MSLKSYTLKKISVLGIISIIFLATAALFFVLKNYLSSKVGEVLSLTFQKSEIESKQKTDQSRVSLEIDEILDQIGDSVVAIDSKSENEKGSKNSTGSGVIIDPNGLIITNSSVIPDKEKDFVVILQNSEVFPVTKIDRDLDTGLVILKIDAKDLKPFYFELQNEVKLGQKVIGIDSSLGLTNSISTGIISGTKKDLKINNLQLSNLIQTDIKLESNNFGGPITDYSGKLLGILIPKDSTTLAIPSSEIKKVLSRYYAKSSTPDLKTGPAYLGVGYFFKDLRDYLNKGEPIGPVIDGVVSDSPASKAGIQVGDIVVAIEGKEFGDEAELTQFIQSQIPGNKISIKVFRKGKFQDIPVVLAAKN